MKKDIYVTKSSIPPLDEYIDEIRSIWDTHWLTNMGEKHETLKKKLKEYCGVDNLELFTNGHMALELSLNALHLRGEVITTPFTFASTTHAIIRNQLTPVFCDIDPFTYTIDAKKIEPLITENTCAILPVHVYGNICNIEEIERIACKYHLKVIYDAAHTFGETYKGKGIGSYGDISMFSFHATKVFNTIEGGAACFKDASLAEKLFELKDFGIKNEEEVPRVGANAKMNEFCAAMGLCNLRHVERNIASRKEAVLVYRELLNNIPGLQVSREQENVVSNYAYFPVVIDEGIFGSSRDEVFQELADNHIYARKYFYPLTNAFSAFDGIYKPEITTPVALKISKQVLTLPLYADMDLDDVREICEIVLKCRK